MRWPVTLALLMVLTAGAWAQSEDAKDTGVSTRAPAEESPPARELLEQVLLARLSRELKLDAEETVLMVRRYTDFREQMLELRAERERLARQLRQALKEEAQDDVLAPLLEQIRVVDEKMVNARMTIYDDISEGLDVRQKARLYLFIGEFETQLRRWLNDARQRRMGGPGLRPLAPLQRRGAQEDAPPPR